MTDTPDRNVRIFVYQDGGSQEEPRPATRALARMLGASLDFYPAGEWNTLASAVEGALDDGDIFMLLSSNIQHTLSIGGLVSYLNQEAAEDGPLAGRATAMGPCSPVFMHDQRIEVPDDAPTSLEALERLVGEQGFAPTRTTSIDARCLVVCAPRGRYDLPRPGKSPASMRALLQVWADHYLLPRLTEVSQAKVVPFFCVVPDAQEASPYAPIDDYAVAAKFYRPPSVAPRIAGLFAVSLSTCEGWLSLEETLTAADAHTDAIVVVCANSPADVTRRPGREHMPMSPEVERAWLGDPARVELFEQLQNAETREAAQDLVNAYLFDNVSTTAHFHILGPDDAADMRGGDAYGSMMQIAEYVCNDVAVFDCDWAFTPGIGMTLPDGADLYHLTDVPGHKIHAFDFGVRTKVSGELVIVKRPYGDDGDMTDDCGDGALTPALYRFGRREVRSCLSACRPANLTLVSSALTSPYAIARSPMLAENAIVESIPTERALGLSYLTYGKEPIGSLLRWLEDTWGLAERSVVVWTDEEPPPDAFRKALSAFNADIVHQPLRDDFAHARNAGFAKLREYPELAFGGFFDPDEYLRDPARDLRALRRMADRPQAIGWLVVALNAKYDGTDQPESRSIRFFNLRMDMWMVGKVHESFAETLTLINDTIPGKNGIREHGKLTIYNPGLAFSLEAFRRKAARYASLLAAEVTERPHHANAWLSLYHNYIAGGWHDEAERAIACAVHCARDREFSPLYFAGLFQLCRAKALLQAAREKAPENAPLFPAVYGVGKHLSAIPGFPTPLLEGDPNPPFPEEAEAALYAMDGEHPYIFVTGADVLARLSEEHGTSDD